MTFAAYPDAARERLVEARFAALERAVREAGERGADLLVVAGDLFDKISAARRDVERAARVIASFTGKLAAVLPGNHDFLSPDDRLWRAFKDASGGSVLVLEEQRPCSLDRWGMEACLYPAPCRSKHAKSNAVGWVRDAPRPAGAALAIGVAHGSLEGVSPDFAGDYHPMTVGELGGTGLDLWLLGHTHVPYPAQPTSADRIFLAGTPEPDGFDCRHEGGAWLLEVSAGGPVAAARVRTGSLSFREAELTVKSASDLAAFENTYSTPGARSVLLRARLAGRVARELREEVGRMGGRLASSVLHLDLRTEDLREEITAATIDEEYAPGSFPHLLLHRLLAGGDAESLEIAHELLEEARR
jgi:DNA repair exonuclease SbcCD nuclease subunit